VRPAVAVLVVETTRHCGLLAAAPALDDLRPILAHGAGGGGVARTVASSGGPGRAATRAEGPGDSPIPPPGHRGSPPVRVKADCDRRATGTGGTAGARTREVALDPPSPAHGSGGYQGWGRSGRDSQCPRVRRRSSFVSDSVILVSVHWPGRVRGGCAQPLAPSDDRGGAARTGYPAVKGALASAEHAPGAVRWWAVITVSARIPRSLRRESAAERRRRARTEADLPASRNRDKRYDSAWPST
jgi:hypothetical protein